MDSTLVTPSIGLEATVAHPESAVTPTARSLSSASLVRSTVLPRVEMVGASPQLVVQGKPRYEHTRRLGEGGLGEVIGAHDNDIDRKVAVKRLKPEMTSPAALARFVEEIRTVGRLEHPNIVPIHDVGVDGGGEYYFVMKYVDGETLESIIEKLVAGDPAYHARYGFERRVQIFTALLEAVAFAHGKGIVHRDIKPANVMIGAYGEVLLMDWGIAKQLRGERDTAANAPDGPAHASAGKRGALFETVAGQLIGTPAYMSPEQARAEAVDERSDVYSLSMLFHELLCLNHPLANKQTLNEILHGVTSEPTPMADFFKGPHQPPVPMDLAWFVRKGLAKHPANRYQSVAEMIERLERRADGDIPVQCPITLMKRASKETNRFVDRHPFVAMTALVATVGFAVANVVTFVMHHVV